MFPLQFVATLWKICKSESVYRRHNVHFRVWIQAHKSLISVAWRSHAFSSVFNNTFDCTNILKEHFCWQRKGQTEDAALQNEISLFTLHDNEYNLISDPADQRLMPAKRDLFNEFGKLIAKIEKKTELSDMLRGGASLLWLITLLQQIHYFSHWVFISLFLCWYLISLSSVVTRGRPSEVWDCWRDSTQYAEL